MVYHFFEKWKELGTNVFSITRQIKHIEKIYMLRVILFQKLFKKFEKKEIDFTTIHKLDKIYKNQRYMGAYLRIYNKLSATSTKELLSKKEITSFLDLLYYLHTKLQEEKRIASFLLRNLLEGKLLEKRYFYEIQEFLKTESQYHSIENKKFQKIEDLFLIKKDPGASYKKYFQFIDAIEKGIVKIDKKNIFARGKILQGISIKHNIIIIKGDHYSSEQNARWIEGDQFVNPSLKDPYSYFVERSAFSHISRKKIQNSLGITSAEAVVSLEIIVFPEQLYIQVHKNEPIKFAIAELKQDQVSKVLRRVRSVA